MISLHEGKGSAKKPVEGEVSLRCGNELQVFSYWAWWNTYRLLILLRQDPVVARFRKRIFAIPTSRPFKR